MDNEKNINEVTITDNLAEMKLELINVKKKLLKLAPRFLFCGTVDLGFISTVAEVMQDMHVDGLNENNFTAFVTLSAITVLYNGILSYELYEDIPYVKELLDSKRYLKEKINQKTKTQE